MVQPDSQKNENHSIIFQKQQIAFQNLPVPAVGTRKKQLRVLKKIIFSHVEDIQAALYNDLHKPAAESYLSEIVPSMAEINYAIRNLWAWCKPRRKRMPFLFFGGKGFIQFRPKGIVLIISPFNYPFLLAVNPLISAIAAGNRVILKPSELTPHTSRLLKELISEAFLEEEVAVIEGDYRVGEQLMELPFDHVFFTGSYQTGKKIMKKAAEHLSSITLELGGKSPAVVLPGADLKDAVRKIVWGKLLNAGQTCIAPDYVVLPHESVPEFQRYARFFIEKYLGDSTTWKQKMTWIVNEGHFQRLKYLLKDALAKGAEILVGQPPENSEERFFPPVVLTNVNFEMEVMREEIFGPVLPLLTYHQPDEIESIIAHNPHPLSLYIFCRKRAMAKELINKIPAGNVVFNDVIVQFGNVSLPFGGLRRSGLGNAHGFAGFRAFSHELPVLYQRKYSLIQLLYPPYTAMKERLGKFAAKWLV